jgi:hypothetical protein
MAGTLVSSQRVELTDGRHVQVLEYDTHEVRFRMCDSPYYIKEAFITGKTGQNTIIMLTPGEDYVPYLELKAAMRALKPKK